jgi:NitT/TauT family transport system substrate-binding protein
MKTGEDNAMHDPSQRPLHLAHLGQAAAVAIGICAALALPGSSQAAEKIKIGTLMTTGTGPIFIAKDKGYFAAEGLDIDIVPFDAGQPVAVAAVSGDIDFGAAGVTSALYTLAGQGALRLIGGWAYDAPSFHTSGILASNRAYADGLTSLKALGGRSIGLTQIGSSYQYAISLVAEKYGVDMKTLKMLPLQSMTNIASSIAGGQADAAVLIATIVLPLVDHGSAKSLGWVGDETPWQVAAIWTSTRNANERSDTITRFLRALRQGAHDYLAAFTGPGGVRQDGPTAPEAYALIGKYLNQTTDQMKVAIGYNDPELRLDVKDVARQIAWFQAQGMIKGEVDIDRVVDKRYATPLPQR